MSRQKLKQENKIEYNSNFWASVIILVIMVLSIGGFAMMSSGGFNQSYGSDGMPENFPMQVVEYEGNTYYVAVKNSEQFVFTPAGVEQFKTDLIATGIADKILKSSDLKISTFGNFSSPDANYALEKVLRGLKIPFEYVENSSCVNNTLILTNTKLEGDCIQVISSNDEAYEKLTAISYHLVK